MRNVPICDDVLLILMVCRFFNGLGNNRAVVSKTRRVGDATFIISSVWCGKVAGFNFYRRDVKFTGSAICGSGVKN